MIIGDTPSKTLEAENWRRPPKGPDGSTGRAGFPPDDLHGHVVRDILAGVVRPDPMPTTRLRPHRRAFLAALATAVAAPAAPAKRVGLSYGTYGLRMLSWEVAIGTIAEMGYDGVEICVMPGYPTEPAKLRPADQAALGRRLRDLGLSAPAFLETLHVLDARQTHADNLARIERAVELGAAIAPGRPPFIETVLGRRTDEWDAIKNQMVDEIGGWVETASKSETTICFKPHAGHAVHDVERSLWLVNQVGSRYFRCTYDYSHFWLAGEGLAESLEALLPVSSYIHVKDARGTADEYEYVLPGDGATNYAEYFGTLRRLGFAGWINVEVSSHIHRKSDYQPIETARLCYERMSRAFEQAKLIRP